MSATNITQHHLLISFYWKHYLEIILCSVDVGVGFISILLRYTMSQIPSSKFCVDELFNESILNPDFTVNGIHFGRGDSYSNNLTYLKHKTLQINNWRIISEHLEEIKDKLNEFYSSETYIIQWKFLTEEFNSINNQLSKKSENEIYFYWKGEDADKGYSPLPEEIEKDNPPVERIVQWSEPPVFLRLFSGAFIVHRGRINEINNEPRLYILRAEVENELHLFEVPLKRECLRSKTSFVLYLPKEKLTIIWHGNKASLHCKNSVKIATGKTFGADFVEVDEGSENEFFLNCFDNSEYFIIPNSKIIDYNPRLFYFHKIYGQFSTAEIHCSHRSDHITPFPFLQSHLYSADQPAIFLLDDNDELWLWYGWHLDEDNDYKNQCSMVAIDYAQEKSKRRKKLVKIHKVIAGFEPIQFTNLFPTWKKRTDVTQIQEKEGMLSNLNLFTHVINYEQS